MPIDILELHNLMLVFQSIFKTKKVFLYFILFLLFYDRKMQLLYILLLDGSQLLGNGRVCRQV